MPLLNYLASGQKLSFEAHDVELSIINSLRRVLLADIPNVAISFDPYNETDHDVTIHTNTTSLHNEITSHRMSLVPICLHPNEILNFQKLQYLFVIKKKNTTNDMQLVTTDDIEVLDIENTPYPEAVVRRIFPHDPITDEPILLTKLKPNLFDKDNGDELHLETRATKSTAAHNAAWSPVSMCSFHNKVDEALVSEAFEEQAKGMAPEKRAELKRRFDTLDRNRCFKTHPHSGEPREVVFSVESVCAMDPAYLVFAGLRVLTEKVEGFAKALASRGADGILEWSTIGGITGFYQMTMKNETHTLGNLLQSEFYKRFIRPAGNRSATFLEFVGYHVPHPLEKTILIKWKFSQGVDLDSARDWILAGTNEIVLTLTRLTHEWLALCKLPTDEYQDAAEFVAASPAHK